MSRMLREAVQMIDAWTADIGQLTGVFWQWRSGTYRDEVLGWLRERMQSVMEMRAVVHQLSSILSASEVTELKVDQVFEHFHGINPLHSSLFSQPKWEAATSAFANTMEPIERIVARSLMTRFSSSGLKPRAPTRVLALLGLARRELVFRELAPARESLLGQLEHDLELLRSDFDSRSGGGGGRGNGGAARVGKNLPDSVENLVLARQVGDKVGDVLKTAQTLLHDLQGMERFERKANDLSQYMSDYQQQYFSDWVARVEDELKDESSGLALQLTGKLMDINQDDLSLQVNYSDKLIVFLREVRQPSALGFKMPGRRQVERRHCA